MQANCTRRLLSRGAVSLLLLLATAQAAEEADALPSLFDFLGAMVEQEGEWVDPLDMAQDFSVQQNRPTEADTEADAVQMTNDLSNESAPVPTERQEMKYETQ